MIIKTDQLVYQPCELHTNSKKEKLPYILMEKFKTVLVLMYGYFQQIPRYICHPIQILSSFSTFSLAQF